MAREAEAFFVRIGSGQSAWQCRSLHGKGLTGKFIATP